MSSRSWRTEFSRRRFLTVAGLGTTTVLLTSCGGGSNKDNVPTTTSSIDFSARFASFEPADEPNGDLSRVTWPDFVLNAGGDVQSLYEYQILHGELMRYMPCFCGCGSDGHQNNRDCYVKSVNADGSVVFDSMAPT
jgi:hypothetical protein